MTGLLIQDGAFEVVVGSQPSGPRRLLAQEQRRLEEFAVRYASAAPNDAGDADLLALGQELFAWLDGDGGQFSRFLEEAERPCVVEVQGPRAPSAAEWALLRAPLELLADSSMFLAHDALMRFSIARRLGRPVEPASLDRYRLGLTFMAAAPRGQQELAHEAEEAAILRAVGEQNVDLQVEESGDPEQLGRMPSMPVVHLSCHGASQWRPPGDGGGRPRPALLLEDEVGDERPTDAGSLVPMLGGEKPGLLFLSACLTATSPHGAPPGRVVDEGGESQAFSHSFASALVEAGMPRVLAWDGPVLDGSATLFAERFYEGLAKRQEVVVAMGDAMRALAQHEDGIKRRGWHRARLWTGPDGSGPVVGGTRKRAMVAATHRKKPFLAKERRQVPVASDEMFVGRRRQLQQALRALRGADHAGVLLHGMGRLGKSSLAARIVNRRPDMASAVVFERYDALSILEAVAAALRPYRRGRELVESGIADVRQRPERLREVLLDILTGPCGQADDDGPPLLLVIDDLERILTAPGEGEGTHRVLPEHAATLAAVLDAFDPAETDSRLLVTSRYPFTLDGSEDRLLAVQLPSFSDVERAKLEHHQVEFARRKRLSESEFQTRRELATTARALALGNPGLQDLFGVRLAFSPKVPVERVEAVLGQMRAWVREGTLPGDDELRQFLEQLALDELLAQAGDAGRALLRACSLFDMPVPITVIEVVAEQIGGSVQALRDLGLLDAFEDVVDHHVEAVMVNPLVLTTSRRSW